MHKKMSKPEKVEQLFNLCWTELRILSGGLLLLPVCVITLMIVWSFLAFLTRFVSKPTNEGHLIAGYQTRISILRMQLAFNRLLFFFF